jgi:phage shock protein C
MEKRLHRSSTNKIIAGVCGGLGKYFEIDPVILRLIAVILVFPTGGAAILVYLIAWMIIPRLEDDAVVEEPLHQEPVSASAWRGFWPGIILVGIGLLLIVRETWYWFHWDEMWPIIFIGAGLFLILRRGSRRKGSDDANTTSYVNNHQPKPENGGSTV